MILVRFDKELFGPPRILHLYMSSLTECQHQGAILLMWGNTGEAGGTDDRPSFHSAIMKQRRKE